jgi:hypothetical protein
MASPNERGKTLHGERTTTMKKLRKELLALREKALKARKSGKIEKSIPELKNDLWKLIAKEKQLIAAKRKGILK